jgi:hypothetical protein
MMALVLDMESEHDYQRLGSSSGVPSQA